MVKKQKLTKAEVNHLDMLSKAYTDANQIIHDLGIVTGRENGIMYSSVNGFVEPFGEVDAKAYLESMRKENVTPSYQIMVLNHIRNKTHRPIGEFSAPEHLIPVKNGIVDVFTGELLTYRKELIDEGMIFTNKFSNIFYDPNAPRPKMILRELRAAQPNPMIQRRILRDFALCFDRKPMKRQTSLWIGENDTRKSTLLRLLQNLLAKPNYSNQTLLGLTSTDQESLRARAELFGKAANIDADLEQIELEEIGLYKALTGGDTINARFMYQSTIEYAPYAKMFEACNAPPIIKDEIIQSDLAFFERFRITFFENKINPNDIVVDYYQELSTEQELSGLFNILMGILRAVWQYRDYGYTFNGVETRALWNRSIDQYRKVNKCLAEYCIETPNDRTRYIPVSEIVELVRTWCRRNSYEVPSTSEINALMRKKCGEQGNAKGVKGRVWRGIAWKNSQSPLDYGNYGNPGYISWPEYAFSGNNNRDGARRKSVISVIDQAKFRKQHGRQYKSTSYSFKIERADQLAYVDNLLLWRNTNGHFTLPDVEEHVQDVRSITMVQDGPLILPAWFRNARVLALRKTY